MKGSVLEAFPASERAIQAFLLQLLLCSYSGATFDKFYSAIIERHKEWDGFLQIPPAKFRIWVKTVQAQLGIPKKQKFTLTAHHLLAMMLLETVTKVQVRDKALVSLGTIFALRPSKIIALDVCDLLFDLDCPGTLALEILKRKNDKEKRCLRPRGCKANDA
eukprot:3834617-Rhodomonas_salina.1